MNSVSQSPSATPFGTPRPAPGADAQDRALTLGRRGPALVLTARGEFDSTRPAQWREMLRRLAQEAGPGGAVVDATGVGFLDCRSLEALLDFHALAESRGLAWVLVPSRAIERPLEALGAESVPRRRSLSEALMDCLLHAPATARAAAAQPG